MKNWWEEKRGAVAVVLGLSLFVGLPVWWMISHIPKPDWHWNAPHWGTWGWVGASLHWLGELFGLLWAHDLGKGLILIVLLLLVRYGFRKIFPADHGHGHKDDHHGAKDHDDPSDEEKSHKEKQHEPKEKGLSEREKGWLWLAAGFVGIWAIWNAGNDIWDAFEHPEVPTVAPCLGYTTSLWRTCIITKAGAFIGPEHGQTGQLCAVVDDDRVKDVAEPEPQGGDIWYYHSKGKAFTLYYRIFPAGSACPTEPPK